MHLIITESERGFLFKKGKFVRMLEAGKYFFNLNRQIRTAKLSEPLTGQFDQAMLDCFLQDENFKKQTISQDVPDDHAAIHRIDGHFKEILKAGNYLYWNVTQKHSFELFNIRNAGIPEDLQLCEKFYKAGCMTRLEVSENQTALLFENETFRSSLTPGIYYFWNQDGIRRKIRFMEHKKRLLSLNGQEILTKDKVGIRLNFVCSFQVTDCVSACLEIDNLDEQFRTAVQLTVREFIAGYTLDELLTQRDEIGEKLAEILRPKAEKLYIRIFDTGMKDIILPGEIQNIMNSVLLAEKKAQANVIARREEVASTRSLLNTAKLMDENKTLYKLKELEYLEKICENVGNISVSGGDLLEHLRAIIGTDRDQK